MNFVPYKEGDLYDFWNKNQGCIQCNRFPGSKLNISGINGSITIVPRENDREPEIELYTVQTIRNHRAPVYPQMYAVEDGAVCRGIEIRGGNSAERLTKIMAAKPLHVVAGVPKKAILSVGQCSGLVRIGDIEGGLYYHGRVPTIASIGKMVNIDLALGAEYLVSVNKAPDSIKCWVDNGCRVSFAEGQLDPTWIEATVNGGSHVDFHCTSKYMQVYMDARSTTRIIKGNHSRKYRGAGYLSLNEIRSP